MSRQVLSASKSIVVGTGSVRSRPSKHNCLGAVPSPGGMRITSGRAAEGMVLGEVMMAIVAPSILSADFSRLGEEIRQHLGCAPDSCGRHGWTLCAEHHDRAHGREGHSPLTDRFIDCHLMIVEPDKYLVDFREAGADLISVHAEAVDHLGLTVAAIKETGAQAGVALNPHTSESVLDYVLEELDLVLIMSVNPGFGDSP